MFSKFITSLSMYWHLARTIQSPLASENGEALTHRQSTVTLPAYARRELITQAHVMRGRKTLQTYEKHALQSALTLIQRRESKIWL